MKNIELTEDHKSKLLEMCNKLFPESKIKFNDDYYTQCDLFIMSDDDCDDEINSKDYVNCHWFEFCMTYLVEKILNPKDLNNKLIKTKFTNFYTEVNSYSWFIQDPGRRENFTLHPIDYLYEEFKKLK